MKKQHIAAVGMAVLLGLGAAACGGGDDKKDGTMSGHEGMPMPSSSASASAPASQGGHNAQDVMFAQMMIPHHRQAVDMAKTVLAKGSDPKVKNLAGRVEKAQAPEIEKMSGWLKGWGESVPAAGGGGDMAGMGHGMDGMMTEKQMADYNKASGKDLDRMFLTMMIEHHRGAVTMAQAEQKTGSSPEAKALADAIIKAQQAEITEMNGLLKS
ncbi:DUF305 domain-containing protein [Actinomadura oligospora]|uniref:DUF305 domain-containing protein n=1 Tax=Actinomadura oligospora TaxID=111804 RepID=UPI0004B56B2C|nr:DUF305 domain-containing protein [Actinomadura oligospora]